jgi:hypothetical protein
VRARAAALLLGLAVAPMTATVRAQEGPMRSEPSRAAAAARRAPDAARADAIEAALADALPAIALAVGLEGATARRLEGGAVEVSARTPGDARALVALHAALDGAAAPAPLGEPEDAVRLVRLPAPAAAPIAAIIAAPIAAPIAAIIRCPQARLEAEAEALRSAVAGRATVLALAPLGVLVVAGPRAGVAPTGLLSDGPRVEVWEDGPARRSLRVRLRDTKPLAAGAPPTARPRLADARAQAARAEQLQALLADALAGEPVEVMAEAGGLAIAGPRGPVPGLVRLALALDDAPGPDPVTLPLWGRRCAVVLAEGTAAQAEARFQQLAERLGRGRGPRKRGQATIAWSGPLRRVVAAGEPAELTALGLTPAAQVTLRWTPHGGEADGAAATAALALLRQTVDRAGWEARIEDGALALQGDVERVTALEAVCDALLDRTEAGPTWVTLWGELQARVRHGAPPRGDREGLRSATDEALGAELVVGPRAIFEAAGLDPPAPDPRRR